MLDHIGFTVSDIAAAEAFYDQALAPLGVAAVMKVSAEQTGSVGFIGYGAQGRPFFWINGGAAPTARLHVALTAPDRATVDAFHRAALAAGGRDNGPPGLRPHYHPDYYGAFVLDPDAHNIEAVCNAPG
jgi:catechol 2,3-dioxygenase-like lactoylglutathione lyase family enzyme